jgi:hypothetical protein
MNPMNIKIRLLALAAASALCVSTALASEIYRYTDADGDVLYSDIPTGDPSEEHLKISSRPTDDDAVQASLESQQEAWKADAQRRTAQEDAEKLNRGEQGAVAAARQKTCQESRDRLISYIQSRRLYREGEDGERVFLDGEESQQAHDQVQALIDENCD